MFKSANRAISFVAVFYRWIKKIFVVVEKCKSVNGNDDAKVNFVQSLKGMACRQFNQTQTRC